ncbi:amino acid permease [Acetobacter aceti]|nr:amino acid permease [Acetobacter aceti]
MMPSPSVTPSVVTPPASVRKLARWHVSMISVGGVIGAGLFVGTSATIAAAGPAVLLAYLGAGTIVWMVMLLLGELAIQHKGRGSFVTHVASALGWRSGFVTGWSYAFLWIVTGAAQAVAGGMILGELFSIPPLTGSIGLVAFALLMNALPVRVYGESEAALSLLKLATLTLFIGLGALWMLETPAALERVHSNLFDHGGMFPRGMWTVPAVIPMIVQTFTGCEIAFVASVESENPEQNIREIVTRLPFLVLLFYLGSVLVVLCLRPWTEVVPGHSPFLLVMRYLNIPFAEMATIMMTLLAVLSCLNSSKYVVSRVLRELSDLGCAPPTLAHSSRFGVPVAAVALTAGLEILIILTAAWSPSSVYTILLGASGTLILFAYLMASISCLRLETPSKKRRISLLAVLSSVVMLALFLVIPCFPDTRVDGAFAFGFIALALSVSTLIRTRLPSSIIRSDLC